MPNLVQYVEFPTTAICVKPDHQNRLMEDADQDLGRFAARHFSPCRGLDSIREGLARWRQMALAAVLVLPARVVAALGLQAELLAGVRASDYQLVRNSGRRVAVPFAVVRRVQ